MSLHRYPRSSLLFDGARAAFGMAVTLGPPATLDVARPLAIALIALGLIFLVFAFNLAARGLSVIEVSKAGISRSGPLPRRQAWSDLASIRLAHYGHPRRSSEGWYQLTIRGSEGALRIESTIDGFDRILAAALHASEAGRRTLDPATSENLKAFGWHAGRAPVEA
ncbi:MAG: hypothetical protein HC869_24310 [Rhodospirillales bacterium]|nr:hypothetical protein [Rhodospirillales bacterium]